MSGVAEYWCDRCRLFYEAPCGPDPENPFEFAECPNAECRGEGILTSDVQEMIQKNPKPKRY